MPNDPSAENGDYQPTRLLAALLDPLAREMARRLRQAEARGRQSTSRRSSKEQTYGESS